MKTKCTFVILTIWLGFALLAKPNTKAAGSSAVGAIEGRVLNTRSGEFLERARITVEGTSLVCSARDMGEPSIPPDYGPAATTGNP